VYVAGVVLGLGSLGAGGDRRLARCPVGTGVDLASSSSELELGVALRSL